MKRNEGYLTTELNDTYGFSFHACDKRNEDSHFGLVIDRDCTSLMIEDIKLLSYLERSQKGKESYANGTESVVESRCKLVFFLQKQSRNITKSSSRKCSACPQVFEKLNYNQMIEGRGGESNI